LNRGIAFLRKSVFFKLWFLPVWLLLGVSKALIFMLTFRRIEKLMGKAHGISPVIPLLTESQRKRVSQIGHVVRVTSRYTPWKSNCYPQAITAALLLRLYKLPYLLCFGLKRSEESGRYLAHAWVASGSVNVTGGLSFNVYTVVACYLEPGLPNVEAS
tara:strand:- start:1527 stop:2000 length:474 start_codon:yes stop_codon:yes gene_type:complete